MTERGAWLYLAEQFSVLRPNVDFDMSLRSHGLCFALNRLCNSKQITEAVRNRMKLKVMRAVRRRYGRAAAYLAPIQVASAAYTDQYDELRVKLCRRLARECGRRR